MQHSKRTVTSLFSNGGVKSTIARFLDSQAVSPASKDVYTRQLLPFFRFAKDPKWDKETVEQYKAHLLRLGYAASTISSYLVLVRKFFDWTEAQGLYPNIAAKVKGVRPQPGFQGGVLSVAQVHKVLESVKTHDQGESRDFVIINLMVRTGLRAIELARADVGDIRVRGGNWVLWLKDAPGGAFVLLTPASWRPLRRYLKARQVLTKNKAPLFASQSDRNYGERMTPRSFSGIVKSAFYYAGLDPTDISAKSLRHTAITLAIQAGATVAEAQAMARHASPAYTKGYAALAEAANRAPGAAARCVTKALRK